ncbi:c-type cytochrome [Malikia sp.]|uniref:c-type cytochrome n=1 Tax=Malikia sp. TaxID=2070706 RepID=UPI00261DC31B|nr:c-type cytochrome [Malikia sp.]MDD2728693.1 cytochrome C [Malikia sp.]
MNKLNILAAALIAGTALTAQAGPAEDALNKSGCMACHAKDKKLVGPSFQDIAAKYKGQGDAMAKLSEKVRKGGAGVWGPIPMPANGPEKINDADLKLAIQTILKS